MAYMEWFLFFMGCSVVAFLALWLMQKSQKSLQPELSAAEKRRRAARAVLEDPALCAPEQWFDR